MANRAGSVAKKRGLAGLVAFLAASSLAYCGVRGSPQPSLDPPEIARDAGSTGVPTDGGTP